VKQSTESIVADLRDLAMFVGLNDKRGASLIRTAADRLEELERVVGKVPRTKDGVAVTEPRELFWWDGDVLLRGAGGMSEEIAFFDPNDPSMEFRPNCGIAGCYSTREAALAAQEAK
jgi:hypothetical protein